MNGSNVDFDNGCGITFIAGRGGGDGNRMAKRAKRGNYNDAAAAVGNLKSDDGHQAMDAAVAVATPSTDEMHQVMQQALAENNFPRIMEQLTAKSASAERDAAHYKKLHDELQIMYDTLERKLKNRAKNEGELQSLRADQKGMIDKYERNVRRWEDEREKLEENRVKEGKEFEIAKKRLALRMADELAAVKEGHASGMQKLKDEFASAKGDIELKGEESTALRSELEDTQTKLRDITRTKEDAEGKLEKVEGTLNQSVKQLKVVLHREEELKKLLASSKQDIESKENMIASLRADVSTKLATMLSLQADVSTLHATIAIDQDTIQKLENNLQSTRDELHDARRKMKNANEILTAVVSQTAPQPPLMNTTSGTGHIPYTVQTLNAQIAANQAGAAVSSNLTGSSAAMVYGNSMQRHGNAAMGTRGYLTQTPMAGVMMHSTASALPGGVQDVLVAPRGVCSGTKRFSTSLPFRPSQPRHNQPQQVFNTSSTLNNNIGQMNFRVPFQQQALPGSASNNSLGVPVQPQIQQHVQQNQLKDMTSQLVASWNEMTSKLVSSLHEQQQQAVVQQPSSNISMNLLVLESTLLPHLESVDRTVLALAEEVRGLASGSNKDSGLNSGKSDDAVLPPSESPASKTGKPNLPPEDDEDGSEHHQLATPLKGCSKRSRSFSSDVEYRSTERKTSKPCPPALPNGKRLESMGTRRKSEDCIDSDSGDGDVNLDSTPSVRKNVVNEDETGGGENLLSFPSWICDKSPRSYENQQPEYDVGTTVSRLFFVEDEGEERCFYGKVTGYNAHDKLYSITYEDGEEEEMDKRELSKIVKPVPNLNDAPTTAPAEEQLAKDKKSSLSSAPETWTFPSDFTGPRPDIGEGWTQQYVPRKNKSGGGGIKYYFSPKGERFTSMAAVHHYLGGEPPTERTSRPKGWGKKPLGKTATIKCAAEPTYAVGTAVSKVFYDEEEGKERPFSGNVAQYDPDKKVYSISYEDGDKEELYEWELSKIAVICFGDLQISTTLQRNDKGQIMCKVIGCNRLIQSGRDGFCKMHFNVAAQSATTAHGAAKKSVTKNDHDAKTTIDDNHGMVEPVDVRSTTTKNLLDLVERTAVKGALLPENQEPTYAVGTAVSKVLYDEEEGKERPLSGNVTQYCPDKKLYSISYEDGNKEELYEWELSKIAVICFADLKISTTPRRNDKGRKKCKVMGCSKFEQTNHDGFCRTHFNMAHATTEHEEAKKSVAKNDHDAKTAIDDNDDMVEPIHVRSTTTKAAKLRAMYQAGQWRQRSQQEQQSSSLPVSQEILQGPPKQTSQQKRFRMEDYNPLMSASLHDIKNIREGLYVAILHETDCRIYPAKVIDVDASQKVIKVQFFIEGGSLSEPTTARLDQFVKVYEEGWDRKRVEEDLSRSSDVALGRGWPNLGDHHVLGQGELDLIIIDEESDMDAASLFCSAQLSKGVSDQLYSMTKNVFRSGEGGEAVFNCANDLYHNLPPTTQKRFIRLEDSKDSAYSDGLRKQYSQIGGNISTTLRQTIEAKLQVHLNKMDNKLRRDVILVTGKSGRQCPSRQQYHIDFKEASDERFFIIVPLTQGQNILVKIGGFQTRIFLALDHAFVGRASLIHAGSETPGARLHFEFVPKKDAYDNSEVKTFFEDDPDYPNLPHRSI